MSKFTMLVGISGSGKSSWASNEKNINEEAVVVLSSDELRKELLDDEGNQKENYKIFEEMNKRTLEALRKGKEVIYDATNLSIRRRMNLLKEINKLDQEVPKEAIVFATPHHKCALNQGRRKREVRTEVVHRQLKQFQMVGYYEGWDRILIIGPSEDEAEREINFIYSLKDEEHDNHNHTHTIKKHNFLSADLYEECVLGHEFDYNILIALYNHDIGKFYAKTYFNVKGEPTKEAHFYGHQNIGAYLYLCFNEGVYEKPEDDRDISLMIQWHMEKYIRPEQSHEKFREMIGEKLADKLEVIHKFDMLAH